VARKRTSSGLLGANDVCFGSAYAISVASRKISCQFDGVSGNYDCVYLVNAIMCNVARTHPTFCIVKS
jgi:hypothetical protein